MKIGMSFLIMIFILIGCSTSTQQTAQQQNDVNTPQEDTTTGTLAQDSGTPTPIDYISPTGLYTLQYDSALRRPTTQHNAFSEFERVFRNGQIYALIIAEKITLSYEELESAALINAKAVDPNAKVLSKNTFTKDGEQILALELSAMIDNEEFIYRANYVSNAGGTIQAITHTLASEYKTNQKTMEEFLAGIGYNIGIKNERQGSYTFLPAHGSYSINYDLGKRNEFDTDQSVSDIQLQHTSNEAYITIVFENGIIELDDFKTAAIANMSKVATDVIITHEEPIIINDTNYRMAKIDATVNGLPLTYLSYYFVGNNMATQFSAFTPRDKFDLYKDEIKDVFNTIIITQ